MRSSGNSRVQMLRVGRGGYDKGLALRDGVGVADQQNDCQCETVKLRSHETNLIYEQCKNYHTIGLN